MRGLIVLATVVALGLPVVVQAAEPITKRQVRAGPAARVDRQIMNQVEDLMAADRDSTDRAGTRPLTSHVLRTRPRTSEVPGLCRVDELTVEFETAGGKGKGPDQAVRASGFTASSFYRVQAEPAGPYDQVRRDGAAVARDPCARFDFWDGKFFAADSDREAIGGHRLYQRMLRDLSKGTVKPICDLRWADDPKQTCTEFLTALWFDKVDVCRSDLPELEGTWCRRFSRFGDEVRIFGVFPKGYGDDAETIRRVDVSTTYVHIEYPVD